MGKLYDSLQKQLKSEEYKKDAEDCLKIYEKLKEMNDGSVWESDWQQLTTIGGWIGEECPKTMAYKPSKLGYVFLKGIEEERKEVRYISVQMAIMSHLSDAQELMSMAVGNGMVSSGWVRDKKRESDLHINFAKKLVLTYPNTSIGVSENELNELWNKTME